MNSRMLRETLRDNGYSARKMPNGILSVCRDEQEVFRGVSWDIWEWLSKQPGSGVEACIDE